MMVGKAKLCSREVTMTLRESFPALQQEVHGHPLAYLDNAATTQKPSVVIEGIGAYYRHHHANIHRTTHYLAYKAEERVEGVREKVRQWIGANEQAEIIFTRGTTDSLNQIAQGYARAHLAEGDEIVISKLEHHSNWLPWERVAQEKGAQLKVVPFNLAGSVTVEDFKRVISPKTKVVALTHLSHVTGKVLPIKEIATLAHKVGAVVVLDAAQSAAHLPLDVKALGVDFLAFSGHKMYGPTGIGILYGRRALLEKMVPSQMGGGVVRGWEKGVWAYEDLPYRLEAGTLPIAAIVGLGHALAFWEELGEVGHQGHTTALATALVSELKEIDGITLVGQGERKGIVSLGMEGWHALDVATQLDVQGIAVRAGLQCAAPFLENLGSVIRVSFGLYNSLEEVERLSQALRLIRDKASL